MIVCSRSSTSRRAKSFQELTDRAARRRGQTEVCPHTLGTTSLPSLEDLRGAGRDDGKARLAGVCARKIKLRPDEPSSNALVFSKRGVCAIDIGACGGTIGAIQK